jgi:hypothetical protein
MIKWRMQLLLSLWKDCIKGYITDAEWIEKQEQIRWEIMYLESLQ